MKEPIFLPLAILSLLLAILEPLRATGEPTHPRVNHMLNTLGLDAVNSDNLRFGWRVPIGKQTAYQIRMSNDWDTGRIESGLQNAIPYNGPPLAPKTAYAWKVKSWIDGKESAWTEASFETAILDPKRDWKGAWVRGGDTNPAAPGSPSPKLFNLMRQSFEIPAGKKVLKARAYVAAGHYGRSFFGFRVNGARPAEVFPLRSGIYTFDITRLVHPGSNVFGACFGDRAGGRAVENRWLCDVDLWFDDGSHVTIGTGAETKGTNAGPVVAAGMFDGEEYDARNEIPWSESTFDASAWSPVVVEANRGKPATAILDWVKTVEILAPVAVTTPKPGMYVFDAGTQISGWQILSLQAAAGTRIQFRFAERLLPDGTLDRSTILNGLPAQQIDIYTCKDGKQTWEPQLTYHGFRYMEVTGLPGKPSADTIRFRRAAADITGDVASFTCSNTSLNRLHRAFYDTELANAFFDQTDCNQRGERAPWSADAFCVAEATMSYFDAAYYWQEKWINVANTRVGPHGESNSLLDAAGGGYGILWGSHCVRIPWDYWQAYGDRKYLAPSYARAKQFADCCINWYDPLDEVVCEIGGKKQPGKILQQVNRKDWLIEAEQPWKSEQGKPVDNPFKPHGDWVRPDGKWFERVSFINSATYYLCVRRTAEMAAILGKTAEATHYQEIAYKIRAAINGKWLVKKDGQAYYLDNDQTPNAIALDYGFVPDDQRAAVAASLVAHIRKLDNHVSTGALGTLSLVPALSRNGRHDVVFDLALQKTLPSWIGMLDSGPGTFWENWTETGKSKCHPFLGGSITSWLHQSVAGIKPLKPGYEEVEIRPVPVGDVTFCNATIPTIRGPIRSNWKIKGGKFELTVSIPGNTTANVYLPGDIQARRSGPGSHDFTKDMAD